MERPINVSQLQPNSLYLIFGKYPVIKFKEEYGNVFGLYHDRDSDSQNVLKYRNISVCDRVTIIKESEITLEIKQKLIEDIALIFGTNTLIFSEKLREFNLFEDFIKRTNINENGFYWAKTSEKSNWSVIEKINDNYWLNGQSYNKDFFFEIYPHKIIKPN
jgi:hypothetical protein